MPSNTRRFVAVAATLLATASPAVAAPAVFFSGTGTSGTDPFGLDYQFDASYGVLAFGIPGLLFGTRPLPSGAPTIASFQIQFLGGSPLSTNVDTTDLYATRLQNTTAFVFFTAAISADRTTATFTAPAGAEIDPGERFFVNVVFDGRTVPTSFNAVYNGTLAVTATPEPATLALLATGLLGVAYAARRRRV